LEHFRKKIYGYEMRRDGRDKYYRQREFSCDREVSSGAAVIYTVIFFMAYRQLNSFIIRTDDKDNFAAMTHHSY